MHKKYFKINILFILIFIIMIWGISYINNYYVKINNKFLRVPNNLKIVNLGSSHGLYGIKYPKDLKAFNFSSVAQPFYYDLKILEKYISNINRNGIVIIPISIFSFYQGNEIDHLNDRYYSFLNVDEVYKGEKRTSFLIKNFSILYNSKDIIPVFNYIYKSLKNKKLIPEGLIWSKKLSLSDKEKLIVQVTDTHLGINDKKFSQNSEISFGYLEELLKLCKEKKLKPVLITTPYTNMYNQKITEKNYRERLYRHIDILKNKYNFDYLDYSHDNRFVDNSELFIDLDHLSETGAEFFTDILLKDLKKINIL